MSKVLLAVLNETLSEMVEDRKRLEATLEARRGEVQLAEQEMKRAKEQAEETIFEDEQVGQKIAALSLHLKHLETKPQVLVEKMSRLASERDCTKHARDVADAKLASARNDLNGRRTRLACAEERYAERQKQCGEVSEYIADVQRSL